LVHPDVLPCALWRNRFYYLAQDYGGSAYHSPKLGAAAVPEPETWAMLLAGRGVMDATANGRQIVSGASCTDAPAWALDENPAQCGVFIGTLYATTASAASVNAGIWSKFM
jgi:hypothetical protein